MADINSPFGPVYFVSGDAINPLTLVPNTFVLTANGPQTVPNMKYWETIIKPPTLTTGGAGAFVLNLTLDTEQLRNGAKLLVDVTTTGTETVAYGTGFFPGQAGITGVAGKNFIHRFTYDSISKTFKATGVPIQVN